MVYLNSKFAPIILLTNWITKTLSESIWYFIQIYHAQLSVHDTIILSYSLSVTGFNWTIPLIVHVYIVQANPNLCNEYTKMVIISYDTMN